MHNFAHIRWNALEKLMMNLCLACQDQKRLLELAAEVLLSDMYACWHQTIGLDQQFVWKFTLGKPVYRYQEGACPSAATPPHGPDTVHIVLMCILVRE